MTKQDAIEILRDTPIDIRSAREDDIHTLYATAQGMAIEALQYDCEKVAESCDDYITIKRQFVLDAINIGLSGYISDDDKLTLEGMGIAVSELPSVQSEKSTTAGKSQLAEEKSTCDLIRRQDALVAVKDALLAWSNMPEWRDNEVLEAMERLPSAQPELIEKEAYIRGFEQGRTQGMIDAQGGKK